MNFGNFIASARDFKGFDEMAEDDDYIHSDGLNVSKPSAEDTASQQQQQQQQARQKNHLDHSQEESLPSTEPTWSLLDRPPRNATSPALESSASPPRQQHQRPPGPASFKKKTQPSDYFQPPTIPASGSSAYLSVVSDAMEGGGGGSSISGSARNNSGYDTDNENSSYRRQSSNSSSSSSSDDTSSDDSDDDSDDDENDPILSQIRQSKKDKKESAKSKLKKKERRRREKEKLKRAKNKRSKRHHPQQQQQQKKKNPNRFMDELDERSASAPQSHVLEMERNAMAARNNKINNSNDADAADNPLSSFKSWVSTSVQRNNGKASAMAAKATSFLKLGPLSRRDPNRTTSNNANGDEENNFEVVSSSNVLGDDELAALAQINSNSQPRMCSFRWCWNKGRANPREAFIAFTMLFAMYAWFFPRR